MRTLGKSPRALVDPSSGRPSFGSFEGPLPPLDITGGAVARVVRWKKWVWLGIASDELWISLAVVRLGYAANAFAFVLDRASRRMLVDEKAIAPPWSAAVADDSQAAALARFRAGKTDVTITRRGAELEIRARFRDLAIEATIDADAAAPPISAISELGPSLVSATEKHGLAPVRGHVEAAGRRASLDGAVAGWDYTHGHLPRNTRWRWAFGLGKTTRGEPIGFNVVDGFVGEGECAAFYGGRVHPIAEPKISYDAADPGRPWRVEGDGIDLTFDVGAVHRQDTNLVAVRSRFLQPAGAFRGTLRIDGRDLAVDGLPGVVEDQDVVW